MKPKLEELRERYFALCHRMQAGVAHIEQREPKETEPKSLRVGMNTAMSDHAALVKVLVDKGILTEEEYLEKLIEFMEREVENYTKRVSDLLGGAEVHLI